MSLPHSSTGGAPSRRRGVLAAAALVLSIASLTACAAGNNADTLGVKPDNAATSVGSIKIQNANVITQPKGGDGPAVLSVTIFNNGQKDETLEAVTLDGGAKAKLTPAKGSDKLTVPAGGQLVIGGRDRASAVVENGKDAGKDGDAKPVTFDFSETGQIKLTAFVFPAKSYFKDFGPTEMPAAGPNASSPSGKPSGSPSSSPSGAAGAPGASASGSPASSSSASAAAGDAAKGDAAKGDGHGAGH
ncbi:DUF461 domain-containing protein [Streptomyces sp. URMC 123]|uniref:DUF461 domain-containing protein n=1 Tax=Streptomyces sp. URMC 123 TaxID=3423403 RepID=UPI003F1C1122